MGNDRIQRPLRHRGASGGVRFLLFVAYTLLIMPVSALAQDELDPNQRRVQVVHASPAVGPVDVYIDGTIVLVGLNFGAVSDPIVLPTGERSLVLTPSGRPRDEQIVDAAVPLEPGPPTWR